MEKIKGGFPPIKYCPDIINKKDTNEKKSNNKIRSIVPGVGINRNVNITQILNNIPKKIIGLPSTEMDDLDIVEEF